MNNIIHYALLGEPVVQCYLGINYKIGKGVEKDAVKASNIFEKYAKLNGFRNTVFIGIFVINMH